MKIAALVLALLALPGFAFGGSATLSLTLADGSSAATLPPTGGSIEIKVLVSYVDVPTGIANVDGALQASASSVFTATNRVWGGPFNPAQSDFAASEDFSGVLAPLSKPFGVVCLGNGSGPADSSGKRNYIAADNGALPWSVETITLSVAGVPGVYTLGFSPTSFVGSSSFDAKVLAVPTTLGPPVTVTVQSAATPLEIISSVSRKTHGTAGVYDRASGTIEGRFGGPAQIVTTFNQPIHRVNNSNADIALSGGTLDAVSIGVSPNDNVLTVGVSSVVNMSVFTIGYPGIAANNGGATTATTNCWRVLNADVNATGAVNNTDILQVRGQLSQPVGLTNFTKDVNANGVINNTDILLVRGQLGKTVAGTCAP